MSSVKLAEVITAVSLHGEWIKILQARVGEASSATLLGIKAKQVKGFDEEQTAQVLKELVAALPASSNEVLGLLSTGELLTRYLTLPSEDPQELQAMALYQLEGMLPFPIQDCVTSVKVLGPAGEATRVLVAAVHRPHVERLLRVCRKAGLSLSRIAASSIAIGSWHRACWGDRTREPQVWLVAELSRESLDMGILVRGSLVYMRQVPFLGGDLEVEELAALLQDTMRAYEREQVGPPLEQITLSGSPDRIAGGTVERLETALELPVRRVDPLERSPFREALSVTAQELSPEVSFSELLGVVCAPRLLELDLLPQEIRLERMRSKLAWEWRKTAALAVAALFLVAGWVGIRIGGVWWQVRQTQEQIRQLKPKMERVKAIAATVQSVRSAQGAYVYQMSCLSAAARQLTPGMTVQFLGLDNEETLVVRGMAPDFAQASAYAAVLRKEPLWDKVILRSARRRAVGRGYGVEFELVLQLKPEGGRKK